MAFEYYPIDVHHVELCNGFQQLKFEIFDPLPSTIFELRNNLLAKPKNKDHVSYLHLTPRFARGLCLRAQECPKIFSVPEPRGRFENFLSPRAYIEGERSEYFQVPGPLWRRQKCGASNLVSLGASPICCIRRRRKLGFFPSPRPYMEEETSEFFHVPELYGGES